jgi:YVTN family beta-propeller protein
MGNRCLKLSLAVLVGVGLQVVTPALATFINAPTAGPEALTSATLATPTGLAAASGGCSGGNAETSVSLGWTGSATRDANANYLVDNYAVLRSPTPAGVYASVGTTSGQPPAVAFTDVNPTGAVAPKVIGAGNGDPAGSLVVSIDATVQSVNSSTNAVTSIAAGQVGWEPNALAVTPDGYSAIAAEGASHQVQIITASSNTVARTVTIPTIGVTMSRPDAVAVTPDGLTAYIVDGANSEVYPLTISSGALGTAIAVGSQGDPTAIVVTPDGNKVYVANYHSSSVSVITTSSNTVTATVTIPGAGIPSALAVTPNSAHVYVADQANGKIVDIATASDTVIATVTVGSMVDDWIQPNNGYTATTHSLVNGGDPNILSITPNGTKLYVATFTAGTVVDIAIPADTITTTINVGGGTRWPNAIAMSPNGCQIYVDDYHYNVMYVYSVATDAQNATYADGGGGGTGDPFAMTVTPDSTTVYSANYYSHTISAASTTTNTVTSTFATGVAAVSAIVATPSQYSYKLQAGHGGWRSALSGSVTYVYGWNPGGWQ